MTRDRLELLLRRPWRGVALPADAVGIPTMLSKSERKLLYTLAREYATGDGAIVDAGCFLGGSTAALLAGVRDRPAETGTPTVVSYDLFTIEPYTLAKFFAAADDVHSGDSFLPHFEANVARFDVPHDVRAGDITQLGWSGEQIDVLFLDVLKSWEINDAVLEEFFPSLVPGRSVIVHQDYGWGGMPWIPITVELLRESLVLVDWMEWGSHVFFLEGEVPPELIENGVRGLDPDRKLELIDRAVDRADGWVRGMLEISRAVLIAERDGATAAAEELSGIEQRYSQWGLVLTCLEDPELGVRPETSVGLSLRPRRWWARR
jgi:SAM-dependent methyltransferase